MRKYLPGAFIVLLVVLLLWMVFFYIPAIKSTTEAENEKLRQENRQIDSALIEKQRVLDSLNERSNYWQAKFSDILSDTTRVKVKYVAIKQGVSALSRDSAVIFFLERTK